MDWSLAWPLDCSTSEPLMTYRSCSVSCSTAGAIANCRIMCHEANMDKKTLNVVATELTLLQIQLNAALLLLQAQRPTVPILEQFRRLVNEGVEVSGLETVQRMEDRLRDGIVFQDLKEMGLDDLWQLDEGLDGSIFPK